MKSSYIFAALLAILVTGWILSGQLAEGNGQPEVKKPPANLAAIDKLPSVRVKEEAAEARTVSIVIRGRSEAVRKVRLKAETSGRIVELLVQEGEKVEEGRVLARLSPEDRAARLAEAKALREQRRIEHEAAERLAQKGFRAETQLVAALAALEAAEALVVMAREELDNTVVRVPFSGFIDERTAEIGDFVEPGDEIALLVDLDPMLIVAQVSEKYYDQIRVGQQGVARLVDGTVLSGKVRFISSVAEPSTRTFRVELEVENDNARVADGVSAELNIPLAEVPAYHVSPAVLSLADSGEIGVKTVTEDGYVQFLEARVIDSDSEGIWLTGLPEKLILITVGQEFVKNGQK
ncbi:MAG: efflux RND transporter periplasmic adaptor subunit, partial [Kiloniellales bacterium]|nr:efflux RND transporter periplasmic adaptor subunit [Kiloniellales bacterium]